MALSSFPALLKSLKDSQKSSTQKHKELLTTLNTIEMKPAKVIPKQDQSNKITIDISILEKLAHISTLLFDIDMKNSHHLQNLTESVKSLYQTKKTSKMLKGSLLSLEKIVYREKKAFTKIVEEMTQNLTKITKPHIPAGYKGNNDCKEKIKKILENLVHGEVIKNCDKIVKCNLKIKLLNGFYIDMTNGDLEAETKVSLGGKRLLGHLRFLIKNLENVALDMMKILGDTGENISSFNEDFGDFIEDRRNKSISPNEFKTLKVKINRLYKRGSLTDEEVKNMMGKINAVPIVADAEKSYHCGYFKGNSEKVTEAICNEEPVTETRTKKKQLNKSLSRDINRRTKSFKRVKSFKNDIKRNSTPIGLNFKKSFK